MTIFSSAFIVIVSPLFVLIMHGCFRPPPIKVDRRYELLYICPDGLRIKSVLDKGLQQVSEIEPFVEFGFVSGFFLIVFYKGKET